MISPKFLSDDFERDYQEFNFTDPITLKTWENLRRVFMDYGKKFIIRNNVNLSIFFVIYITITIALLLEISGVLTTFNDPLVEVILAYEAVVVLMVFFIVLF